MSNKAIFYGSTSGNTEAAAKKIKEYIGEAELINVNSLDVASMTAYDNIIIGTLTWGVGDLQDDWGMLIDQLSGLNLSGKKIAFFGTGDQEAYSDTYVDAIGILYDALQNSKAEFIGAWPTDGYNHSDSKAERNGVFVGLALDDDNQPELTEQRIKQWVEQIKAELL
jgi:flavodoxin I